jgi:hypothetical protein
MSASVSGGVRRGLALAVVAISPLLVVAACSSSPKPGVIEGTARPCIGALSTRPPVLTIIVTNHAGREVARQVVGSPYAFRFTVVRGEYAVSASGVAADGFQAVHVRPHHTESVTLTNSCR